MDKLEFTICGNDKYTRGMICIPEDDGNNYLCRDGKVYSWPADKLLMNDIVYFHKVADAKAVLDKYNAQFAPRMSADITELVAAAEQRGRIVKLKNMVKDLRIRYNPELLVELYKFVESM